MRAWRYAGELVRSGASERAPARSPLPYHLGLGVAVAARALARALLGPELRLPGILIPERYRARFRSLRFPNQKAVRAARLEAARARASPLRRDLRRP